MSGSSYWPMSAVYVHGTAPLSRIHATATEVSRPPEKAIPTRSPTGREASTLVMTAIICIGLHDHATPIADATDSAPARPRRMRTALPRFLLLSDLRGPAGCCPTCHIDAC